jgi:hypothetical protein
MGELLTHLTDMGLEAAVAACYEAAMAAEGVEGVASFEDLTYDELRSVFRRRDVAVVRRGRKQGTCAATTRLRASVTGLSTAMLSIQSPTHCQQQEQRELDEATAVKEQQKRADGLSKLLQGEREATRRLDLAGPKAALAREQASQVDSIVLHFEGSPSIEYRQSGTHEGWPRYQSADGLHLYYYAPREQWLINDQFVRVSQARFDSAYGAEVLPRCGLHWQDKDCCISSIVAKLGPVPTGWQKFQCWVSGKSEEQTTPVPACVAPLLSPDTPEEMLHQARPVPDAAWVMGNGRGLQICSRGGCYAVQALALEKFLSQGKLGFWMQGHPAQEGDGVYSIVRRGKNGHDGNLHVRGSTRVACADAVMRWVRVLQAGRRSSKTHRGTT